MRSEPPLQQLRDAVRLTLTDVILLTTCLACFALILVAQRIGYEPAGFAFWGAIAFSVWVLSIVNRLVGTIRLMHERIVFLQRELEDLADKVEKGRQTRRVLPDELQN